MPTLQVQHKKTNTRSFPGTHTGSDQDLALMEYSHLIQPEETQRPQNREVLHAKEDGKFAAHCVLDSSVDTLSKRLKEVLPSTAEEVLGRQRRFNLGSHMRFWIGATRDGS